MFRIRSKSSKSKVKKHISLHKQAPNRNKENKNHYLCLSNQSNAELLWVRMLENQMDLESTVVAFQSSTNIKIDAKQKLRSRQTFLLKKQIINCISHSEFGNLLKKLNQLKQKAVGQSSIANLMIEFYHIRQKIIANKFKYDKQLINHIKANIIPQIQRGQKQRFNFLTARILYILALHIIKLEGVLIKQEDIEFINAAFHQKRKYISLFGTDSFKSNLESLLFANFQFYRILYRIKSSEQLVIQHYKQIKGYIAIFKQKLEGYQQFQNQVKISQKLQELEPISLCLNIYSDYEKRRALSFKNTQQQLDQIHKKSKEQLIGERINSNIKDKHNKIQENCPQSTSSEQEQIQVKNLSNQNSPQFCRQTQLQVTRLFADLFQKNDFKNMHKIPLQFDFILPEGQQVFLGKFIAKTHENSSAFNIQIVIKSTKQYKGIFKLERIYIGQNPTLYNFAKKVWKTVKQNFYTDKTQFMPSLFSFQPPPSSFLPKNLQFHSQIPILIAIHVLIIHYLKKIQLTYKINGQIYPFPLNSIQGSRQRRIKQKQPIQQISSEQRIFAKRLGFISFDKKLQINKTKKTSFAILLNKNDNNTIFEFNITNPDTYRLHQRGNKENIGNILKYRKYLNICRNIKNYQYTNYKLKHDNNCKLKSNFLKIITYLLQKQDKEDQMKIWVDKIDKILNGKPIQYKFENKFEMVESDNYLQTIDKAIKIKRMKNRKFYKKNPLVKSIIKTGKKLQLVNESQYKFFTIYQNQKNFTVLMDPKNSLKKNIYKKFRIYKQYFQYQNSENGVSKYYVNKKLRNIYAEPTYLLCAYYQRIILQNYISKIVKISKTHHFCYVNYFITPSKKQTLIQVFIFKYRKRFYSLIPIQTQILAKQQLSLQFTEIQRTSQTKLIFNQAHLLQQQSLTNQQKLICDAQSYYELLHNKCHDF